MRNVLISGGWGYGNIGDDAILLATRDLVARHMPAAQVTWLSYDPELTRGAGIEAETSVHRAMDGARAFGFMQTADKCVPAALWPKVPRRICEKFVKGAVERLCATIDRRKHRGAEARIEAAFRTADLFIMSGGGYFNKWDSMFAARIRELELAHENGCKVILIGQSIGPFTEAQREILKRTLKPTDIICVRDPDSVEELKSLGFEAALAPDLAMGFPKMVKTVEGKIVVVPAELNREQEHVLAEQLAAFVASRPAKILLTLTRLIYPDIATLERLQKFLKARGVVAELHIPKSYDEMLADIEGAELVISRGLHAMILGWRSGSKVFALTKSRKVDGFLKAIGSEDFQCAECEWKHLNSTLQHIDWGAKGLDVRESISQDVEDAFASAIKKAGER